MRLSSNLFAIVALALAGIAHAERLTDARIEGFAASLPEVEKLVDAYEAGGGRTWDDERLLPKAGEDWAPMSGAVAEMAGQPYYEDFLGVIKGHGFDSAEQWGEVGDRITRAMVALELKEEEPDMRADMEAAIAQIEGNPNLSPEQKAMMRQSMVAAAGILEAASDASPEDVAAVEPHREMLSEVMDDE